MGGLAHLGWGASGGEGPRHLILACTVLLCLLQLLSLLLMQFQGPELRFGQAQ